MMQVHLFASADRWLRRLPLLLISMIWAGMTFAQTISGVVTDAATNEPLVGASVFETGTNNGVATDVDGRFSLRISKSDATISVSYAGYETQQVRANGAGTNVQLKASAILEEVVVTALGIERSQKTLTYSAQRIGGENVSTVRDGNMLNTLSGKVAGAVVTTSASGPGGASRIILRGNRSIDKDNDALIVVDGVIYDNSKFGQVNNDFGGYNGNDGAANINPDDIENITVLKGSNASALYGSRAQNGVIIITTKKGKAGKIQTDINSGFTMENPFLLPALQNTYGQGAGGNYNAKGAGSWGPQISGQSVTDWLDRTNQTLTAQPNNVRDFFETGTSLNNSIGITGGSEKLNTYLSYTNNKVQGMIPENSLERHTFNLRIGSQVTKRLSVDGKITYVNQEVLNRVKSGEEGAIVMDMYLAPRNINTADLKENYNKLDANGTPYYWTSSSLYQNPYWLAYNTHVNAYRNRVTALGIARYQLASWLTLQGRVSQDRYTDQNDQIFSDKTLLWAQSGGSFNQSYDNVNFRNLDVLLMGNHKIGNNLSVNYNLGAAREQKNYKFTFINAAGLLVPNRFDPRFGRSVNGGVGASPTELQSVYATAQIGFKDYLFLDITGRNDWSSQLPKPYNYFFPSVGLTAVVSDMVKLPDFVTFGKLRASYAKTGNGNVGFDQLVTGYNLSAGGTGGFVSRESTLKNPDLKPELTNALEIGADWRFFHNRIGIDLTWYDTRTINQVLRVPLPPATGYNSKLINAGEIQNTGIELQLSVRPIQSKDLNWESSVNYARNRSNVIELYPGEKDLPENQLKIAAIGGGYSRSAEVLVRTGSAYGDLYAVTWANKKVTADGNTTYTYEEGAGPFLVDDNGKPRPTSSNVKIGNINPKYTLGWNNTFTMGKISLGLLVDGRFGGIMVSGTEANMAFYGNADYTASNRDTWTLEGNKDDGSRNDKAIKAEDFWTTVSGGRYSWGGFFAYDATNVRIREASLGYDFQLKSQYVKGLRLSLVGRNLAWLYRGNAILDLPGVGDRKMNFDPDVNLGASNFQGIEYGNLPSTRSIGVNLRLSF